MKTIAHGDAATVVWLNPDSRRNSAVLIEPEAVFTSTTTSQEQITTKIKSVGSGGQICTRSVQKVFRRNQTNWSSDSSVISADSEPAARLHWADWSSLAAAVCVMIPPEICSAPSPLHLTATLHLLSAARTTSWHTLVTLKLWNIQMCWNITFNRHFESYFTGKQTPEEATIKKQKQRHFDRLGYLITSLFFTCREICPCWTPYTVRLWANHSKAEAASEKGSWLAALIQEMITELDVTEKSPQWKGEVAF